MPTGQPEGIVAGENNSLSAVERRVLPTNCNKFLYFLLIIRILMSQKRWKENTVFLNSELVTQLEMGCYLSVPAGNQASCLMICSGFSGKISWWLVLSTVGFLVYSNSE